VSGIGGSAGVVGCAAGSIEGGSDVAEGLVCAVGCASSDVESTKLATIATRIGAKLRIGL
jgi:hypothetical protein